MALRPAVTTTAPSMERAMLAGVALLRGASFVWLVFVLIAQRHSLLGGWHIGLAWSLAALALAVTVFVTLAGRSGSAIVLDVRVISVELVVGLALMAFDGLVFAHGHVTSGQSSLAAAWPLAGVLTAGIAFGAPAGIVSGLAVGVARCASVPLNGAHFSALHSSEVVSLASTLVLYGLAGGVAGYAARLLRSADDTLARAHAREDVSRTLHDGVLQTLALVERRVDDPQLATMARRTERDLRAYLAGAGEPAAGAGGLRRRLVTAGQLEGRLRRVSAGFESVYAGRADVVVAGDVPALDEGRAVALEGAVGEALVNARKHGAATRATVFVEPADGKRVFCSVKDNGRGFDPSVVTEGLGLRGSIRGRIEDAGGQVEVDSAPGRGAEVRMWV